MGDKYVVVRLVLPQARLDLVDLATQFLMCLRQLQAERDCAAQVAVVGSHWRQPFRSAPPCLTQSATGTRCWHYPIMTIAAPQARRTVARSSTDAHPHLGHMRMPAVRHGQASRVSTVLTLYLMQRPLG